jgi:3-phosphoglycerate kinase
VLAILGGAKVADKLMLVRHMLKFADEIILGGGMKNPFLTQVFNKKLGDSINILPDDPK